MTVSATFASIDDSASLFGGGELCHSDWSHLFDVIFQFFSRNNRKNEKRQREEADTGTEGDHMRMAEPAGPAELVCSRRTILECGHVF